MNLRLILSSELTWIALIFISSLIGLLCYKQKNSGNEYVKQLSNTLIGSLLALAVIFLGYFYFHPKDGGLFDKLISGEVIVGVAVAFPILFTWYRKDQKEKAASKAIQEEEKKKQKEQYDYQEYTEIKSDYLTWYKSFYEDKMNKMSQILAIVNLEQIIDRVEVFDTISDNKKMHPIDFTSLFVMIQERLKECSNENEKLNDSIKTNSIYDSWRGLNNKIISNMSDVHQHAKNADEVYAIDFSKNSSILQKYRRSSKFYGCKFKPEIFIDFISQDDGFYEFYYTLMERKLTSAELAEIEIVKKENDLYLEHYLYSDDLGNTLLFDRDQEKEKQDSINLKNSSEEFPCSLSNDLTQTSESLSQEEFSCSLSNDLTQTSESPSQERPSNSCLIYENSDLIYENRDLADYGPINDLIESGKSITVKINNDNSSIKQKIFDKLKLRIPMLNKIENDHYFISRSKNFVPDMKDSEQKKWEWHSWNVLTKMKTEDKNIKYYIFAVQISDRAFECIVINRANLGELLKHKTMTKDLRYFFYFAKEKK